MERLDVCLGPDKWKDEYTLVEGGYLCYLSIKINDEWITKVDGADGLMKGDNAVKGGISDALKRAAVKFGIGRYLYKLPQFWVDLKPGGKYLAQTPNLPPWALPKDER